MASAENALPARSLAPGRIVRVSLLIGLGAILGALAAALTGEKLTFLYKEQLHLNVSAVSTIGIIVGIPSYL